MLKMTLLLRLIREAILQAWQQLYSNKLRSFLSLLGIAIGIFCIIAVMSAVDSLKKSIVESFEKLGNDVIYVDKRPWNEDPSANYWKYVKWPRPDYRDFKSLSTRLEGQAICSYNLFLPGKTLKYRNSSVQGLFMVGATYDYNQIFSLDFAEGRYFSPFEYEMGANQVILGHEVKDNLFGKINAEGREIKMMGRKFQVIGTLAEEGESLINVFPLDRAIILNYNTVKKLLNSNSRAFNSSINVKPTEQYDGDMSALKGEVTLALRAARRLKPSEPNNFFLNELTMIADALNGFFGILNSAGIFIGLFAILVGMFSVANIMFVSVKERTPIIGIKKALGAKRFVILLEFLIESVILCLVGGVMGLGLVLLTFVALNQLMTFEFFLSMNNIVVGVGLSVIIGLVSGVLPALRASRLDPVVAIRS